MSVLNVSEKTVNVFNQCGFDILGYFNKLNENMDVILRILQYHTDVSNPQLTLEQRKKISIEFFDYMEDDKNNQKLHQFVEDLQLFDRDLAQCVASKDINAAKEIVDNLIPDISRLTKFVEKHKKKLKKVMNWIYNVVGAADPDSKLEEIHQSVCPKTNTTMLIVIIMILLGAILYLYLQRK